MRTNQFNASIAICIPNLKAYSKMAAFLCFFIFYQSRKDVSMGVAEFVAENLLKSATDEE